MRYCSVRPQGWAEGPEFWGSSSLSFEAGSCLESGRVAQIGDGVSSPFSKRMECRAEKRRRDKWEPQGRPNLGVMLLPWDACTGCRDAACRSENETASPLRQDCRAGRHGHGLCEVIQPVSASHFATYSFATAEVPSLSFSFLTCETNMIR